MGKTHEALEWAEREQEKKLSVTSYEPKKGYPTLPKRASNNGDRENYENLKINLLTRYPGRTIKTILFSSTYHGDGASTTAVNFANTLAKNCNMKVLLIDVNLRTPGLHEVYKLDRSCGLTDLIADHRDPEACIKKPTTKNLFVLAAGNNHSIPSSLFESARFEEFLKSVREKYDYVILDAPPVPIFSEARIICSKVDGVVLVIGSGKTRRQVALRAVKELEDAGGRVLGVVLNRRKFYIPNWLYKKL